MKSTAALVLLMLLCAAAPAAAQDRSLFVAVGYQFLRLDGSSYPIGIGFIAGREIAHVAILGEAGWSRHSTQEFGFRETLTVLHVGAGFRWHTEPHRLRPFGQFLMGAERDQQQIEKFGSDSDSGVLLQPGAGVELVVGRRQDVVAEVDWRHVFHKTGDINGMRILAGFRIGVF